MILITPLVFSTDRIPDSNSRPYHDSELFRYRYRRIFVIPLKLSCKQRFHIITIYVTNILKFRHSNGINVHVNNFLCHDKLINR